MEICAFSGEDNAINIFDSLTGDTIATLRGHEDVICCVRFSTCGTLLVSGSYDCTVKLWDCQSWQILQSINDMESYAEVMSVGFSAAADRIVSSHGYGVVLLWSVESGMMLLQIEIRVLHPGCACFTNNDTVIAVTSGTLVNMYDACSGELMQSLSLHNSRIRSIHFSYDGSMMVSADQDPVVILSNVTSGEEIQVLEGHTDTVTQVCFNAEASRIVSSSWDKTARIWDVSTGECLLTLAGNEHYIHSCCFSEDGSKVMTADEDGSVKVWDSYTASAGVSETNIFDLLTGDLIATLRGHEGHINCVSFSTCGTLLASGSSDCTVKLWDCQTWSVMMTLTRMCKHVGVRSVGFSAAVDRIVSSYDYGVVIVWSVEAGSRLLRIETGVPNPFCAYLTNNDTTIAVTCGTLVNTYNACTGELMQSLSLHSSRIRSINFSHDGIIMASAGHDRCVVLSNVASGEVIRVLEGHTNTVSEVCFNVDASRIMSSSWDGTARIWDVSTGAGLLTLTASKHFVRACCFSEDERKVITGSDEGAIKVWDSYTGEELMTCRNLVEPIFSLSCCPSTRGSYI